MLSGDDDNGGGIPHILRMLGPRQNLNTPLDNYIHRLGSHSNNNCHKVGTHILVCTLHPHDGGNNAPHWQRWSPHL